MALSSRLWLLAWPGAAMLGLAAERVQFGWDDPRRWIPDVAVGWSFVAGGLIASRRRPENRSGLLMIATGLCWFIGNFARVGIGPIEWASQLLVYLYLGPLIHLLLAYPTGRVPSRVSQTATAIGYVVALSGPIWRSEIATIAFAATLVGISARSYIGTTGPVRRARLLAFQAAAGIGLALGGYAAARLVLPSAELAGGFTLAFQATLVVVELAFLASLLSATWQRSAVTDLMVELGEVRTDSLRDALARALADPTLEVGYWIANQERFVDSEGRPVSIPEPGLSRAMTMVEHDRRPIAMLVHAPAVLDDAGLTEAVAAAAKLAASNARLQAEVRARVAEVIASRVRILDAGDAARRGLERSLREGAERRLTHLVEIFEQAARPSATLSTATVGKIDAARAQLSGTLEELRELGRGIHPRALTEVGLARAIGLLADRSSVPVVLSIGEHDPRPRVDAAIYFFCAEALANVAKYAAASWIRISVVNDDQMIRVEVADDGCGGADAARGTGMRGLADRIEALGGTFDLESPPGMGTCLRCRIPLPDQASTAERRAPARGPGVSWGASSKARRTR